MRVCMGVLGVCVYMCQGVCMYVGGASVLTDRVRDGRFLFKRTETDTYIYVYIYIFIYYTYCLYLYI